MTEQEIRLELAKAAIAAGADTTRADEWFYWVTHTRVWVGDESQATVQADEEEERQRRIDNIVDQIRMSYYDAAKLHDVLDKDDKILTLKDATLIARLFINARAKEEVVKLLKNGTIKGELPKKEAQKYTRGYGKHAVEAIRIRPVGNYQIQKLSLVKWLYDNCKCRTTDTWVTAQLYSIANAIIKGRSPTNQAQ